METNNQNSANHSSSKPTSSTPVPRSAQGVPESVYQLTADALTIEGQGICRLVEQPTAGSSQTQGLTVFCKNLLPGETGRIQLTSRKKNYAQGQLLELMDTSAARIEPFCPVYGECGGCNLQHLNYDAQLTLKREHLVSCLTRIGKQPGDKIEEITHPTIGMDHPYEYRNHMQYPVSETIESASTTIFDPDTGKSTKTRTLKIGLFGEKSHQVVVPPICKIAHPACEAVRQGTIQFCLDNDVKGYDMKTGQGLLQYVMVRVGQHTGEVMVTLAINNPPRQSRQASTATNGKPEATKSFTSQLAELYTTAIIEALATAYDSHSSDGKTPSWELKSLWLQITPPTTGVIPTQNNRRKTSNYYRGEAPKLIPIWGESHITDKIGANTYKISPQSFFQINTVQVEKLYNMALKFAGTKPIHRLLDLYCGTGTIGQHLAGSCDSIVGIESNSGAVEDARLNAQNNHISQATYIKAQAEDITEENIGGHPDCIVIDPPRKGCDLKLLKTILELAPAQIIYVSCDPATLARDIAVLTGKDQKEGEEAPASNSKSAIYELKEAQPVDMFCWGGHVETVVLLSRKS